METVKLDQSVASLPPNYWTMDHPPALAFATSGSTGEPKWISHSRDALLASAASVNRCFQVTSRDVWMRALPLFHVAGVGVEARAFAGGTGLALFAGRWNAGEFFQALELHQATLTSLVPTQIFDIMEAGLSAPPLLRRVLVGGGRLDPELASRARTRGWPLRMSYGLTEAASTVAVEDAAGRLQLLDLWDARVNGDGLLELHSSFTGWFATNDRAEVNGREMRWLGRADLLVKIFGELVDIGKVEEKLSGLAGEPVVVLAIPDARAGNRLVASMLPEDLVRRYNEGCPPLERLSGRFPAGEIRRSQLGKIMRSTTTAAVSNLLEGPGA